MTLRTLGWHRTRPRPPRRSPITPSVCGAKSGRWPRPWAGSTRWSSPGGIGENAAPVRAGALDKLGFLGLSVDPDRNAENAQRSMQGRCRSSVMTELR